jgi:hypothetical protein
MEQYFKDKPKEKFGKLPELPDDLKRVQLARARERSDRLRTDIESGDVLARLGRCAESRSVGRRSTGRQGSRLRECEPILQKDPLIK